MCDIMASSGLSAASRALLRSLMSTLVGEAFGPGRLQEDDGGDRRRERLPGESLSATPSLSSTQASPGTSPRPQFSLGASPLPACTPDGILFGGENPIGSTNQSAEQVRWLIRLSQVLPMGTASSVQSTAAFLRKQNELKSGKKTDPSALLAAGSSEGDAVTDDSSLGGESAHDGFGGVVATAFASLGQEGTIQLDATSFCAIALSLGRSGLAHELN